MAQIHHARKFAFLKGQLCTEHLTKPEQNHAEVISALNKTCYPGDVCENYIGETFFKTLNVTKCLHNTTNVQ